MGGFLLVGSLRAQRRGAVCTSESLGDLRYSVMVNE